MALLDSEIRAQGVPPHLARNDASLRPWFPATAVERMALHPWLGNVRGLRNVIEELVRHNRNRGRDDFRIPHRLAWMRVRTTQATGPRSRFRPQHVDPAELSKTYTRNAYNVTRTAKELGWSPNTVKKYLEKAGYVLAKDVPPETLVQALEAAKGDRTAAARALRISVKALEAALAAARASSDPSASPSAG